eukprot:549963-Pleurochrysis_carterae.AAC.1
MWACGLKTGPNCMRRHAAGATPEHGSWCMDSPAKARRAAKRKARAAEADAAEVSKANGTRDNAEDPISASVRQSPRHSSRAGRRDL